MEISKSYRREFVVSCYECYNDFASKVGWTLRGFNDDLGATFYAGEPYKSSIVSLTTKEIENLLARFHFAND